MARLAFGVLSRTPPPVGEAVGRGLGRLAYRLGWRRAVVESQLGLAFPDRDPAWVQTTARSCFEHVGQEWLSVPYVTRRGLDEVRKRVRTFEGRDVLRQAYEEGKGVVVVSGHFGNWELAGSALAAFGYPVDAVMQGIKNHRLNQFIIDIRRRNGMELIDRARAWDVLVDRIGAGRVVAFVADQDAGRGGVFVPFFGQPASTHRAPALLALRTGAPFLVGGAQRIGAQDYAAWIERIEAPGAGEIKEQVSHVTGLWLAELERRVRLYPDQYFWHHKRWKTKPSGTASVAVGTSK